MKIVLITTTFLVAVLAIGMFGINNTFAQEGAITPEGMNNTMPMGNDTSGMMKGMDDDDSKMKLNGTIDVHSTMAEAFKSKVTTDIIGAIQAAQTSVGANSFVKEAELTPAHGYLVYKIKVVDENMKKYKVIVDPGNGQVLMKKEITWEDEHEKMKYGEEKEKYGKYGHDEQYDKKKMMMMKDKKY
jgi:Peptidase propeptide and YPEB domain